MDEPGAAIAGWLQLKDVLAIEETPDTEMAEPPQLLTRHC
jgi:hypothetical protein